MTAFTVSDLGQIEGAGDRLALFLKVFSGMVLNAYDTIQVTGSRQTLRNITSGKTAQFPSTWKASGGFHTPGDELTGQSIEHSERMIAIQSVLVADVFIAEIDELMNHYQIRQEYAHQLGEYIANVTDTNSFRAIAIGSEAAHSFDAAFDGTSIEDADMATSAAVLQAAVYDSARYFDEKDVPRSERYIGVKPVQYYKLLTDGEFINRDYSDPNGSRSTGVVERAAGLEILMTNNIPQADDLLTADVDTQLQFNFTTMGTANTSTNTAAVWHKGAIGKVTLQSVTAEAESTVRHQGTLLVAKVAQGQNFLRPEGCISFVDIP